jgi:hypothetical protein
MALIKFGGGVVGMSGSIAGNTFARNRYGSYVRSRIKPINPNTSRQQTVRNCLSDLTSRWSQVLTATQRTSWNLYAASLAMTNKFGETMHLSGCNHYLRSNSILMANAKTPVDAGPTLFELPATDSTMTVTGSETTQLITINFDDTLDWAGETGAFMALFQGSPQNAQRNFFNGPWRSLGLLIGSTTTPIESPQTKTAQFVITAAQRVWIYARIMRADGRVSTPFRADCTIGA